MLGELSGLLGWGSSILRATNDGVNGVAEAVSPGSTRADTTTGNLIGERGVIEDVTGVETGGLTGGVQDVYNDVIGPGGIVHNLGEGGGLGVEGLLDNVLGVGEGILG